ncbi:MAG: ABC transporter substrate-binding protein [Thermoanaerobaculia bacterium]|nr:ABC transporter substrate-binding protein [Thermoanaerobaculia bacterium]
MPDGASLLAVLASACAPDHGTEPALEKVIVGIRPHLSFAEVYVAFEEGFFAAEGLDVEITTWVTAATRYSTLTSGQVDVVLSGPFDAGLINLVQRGARLQLVAARHHHVDADCGYAAFVARRELIETGRLTADPASLRGLRVVTDRTMGNYYYWHRLLAAGGLTIDDVELHDLHSESRPIALQKGLVDVVSVTEPWVLHATNGTGAVVWKKVGEILPERQNTFLVYGPRLLDSRRDLGERFMRAYLRGVERIARDGASRRNVEILSRHLHMPEEQVARLCWPTYVPGGVIDPRGLLEYQEWALKEGLIDVIVPPSRLIDGHFLGHATLPGHDESTGS